MGNSRSEVQLAIQLDKQFYYAGETLNGKVLLNAKKKLACAALVLFIEGTEISEFQTVGNINVKGINNLINTNYVLQQFPMGHQLDGQHVFPFSFKFMTHLPGSYNETRGYKAQISYKIKAILQLAARDRSPIQNSTEIIIREPQKMDQTTLFGQCFAKCVQFGCLDRGVSRVGCYFEKNYYFPSDDCVVLCQVDNIKCKLGVRAVHCRFIKEVTLTAGNGTSRMFTQELNVSQLAGVGAGQGYSGQNSQRSIIRLIYKDNQQGVHPSTNGQLVKCEYYLLVRPQFAGCFVSTRQDQFRVKVNILQPAMVYQPIVQPDSWRPSLQENSNILLNYNEKNELLSSMNEH